jgi:capsule polysaccharide modification protein KpsS
MGHKSRCESSLIFISRLNLYYYCQAKYNHQIFLDFHAYDTINYGFKTNVEWRTTIIRYSNTYTNNKQTMACLVTTEAKLINPMALIITIIQIRLLYIPSFGMLQVYK